MAEKNGYHCSAVIEVPISTYCFFAENQNLTPTELPFLPPVPGSPLTPRQLEIYRWVLRGVEQKPIAELVNSSLNTVKKQLAKSKEKICKDNFRKKDSLSTALFCLQQGYIHPDEITLLKEFYGEVLLARFAFAVIPHKLWLESICDLAAGVEIKEVALKQYRSEEAIKTHLDNSAKALYLPGLKSDVMVMLAILSEAINLSELELDPQAFQLDY